jgi:DnaD/phage-associated family protein
MELKSNKIKQFVMIQPVAFSSELLSFKSIMKISDYDFTSLIYVIQYCNTNGNSFDIVKFSGQFNLEKLEILERIESLVQSNLIELVALKNNKGMYNDHFALDRLYTKLALSIAGEEEEVEVDEAPDFYSIVEEGFNKVLSSKDIHLISTWISHDIKEFMVRKGLEVCIQFNKLNVPYLNTVLLDWKKNNLITETQIDEYIFTNFNFNSKVRKETPKVEGEYYDWMSEGK